MKKNNIIPYAHSVKDINYEKPVADDKIDERTAKAISNAWEKTSYLDDLLQNAGSCKRERNIRYSESHYKSIRDSDKAKNLRYEHYEWLDECKKKLKKQRIKNMKIEFDELTNEPLNKKTCEFSHIRSCSMYPEIADDINNGLIINKNTHDIITQNGINDEDELYDLCLENKKNNQINH